MKWIRQIPSILYNWIVIRTCYNKYCSYPDDIPLDAYRSEPYLERMVDCVMGISVDGTKEIQVCVKEPVIFKENSNVLFSFSPSQEHFIFASPSDHVAFLGKIQGAEMQGTKIGRILRGYHVQVHWLDNTHFLFMVQENKERTWYSIRNVHDNFTTEPLDKKISLMKCATIKENMHYYRIAKN